MVEQQSWWELGLKKGAADLGDAADGEEMRARRAGKRPLVGWHPEHSQIEGGVFGLDEPGVEFGTKTTMVP